MFRSEKNCLLAMLACSGLPIADFTGKFKKRGWIDEKGLLTAEGKSIARKLALGDPEVLPEFKERVKAGEF